MLHCYLLMPWLHGYIVHTSYYSMVKAFTHKSFCCDLPSLLIVNNNKFGHIIETLGVNNLHDNIILGLM